MNTPYKQSKLQKLWFKYSEAGKSWKKPELSTLLGYHVCEWYEGKYISVDYYKRLAEARKTRDNMRALNPQSTFVIIGDYGKFQALEK